MNSAIRYSPTVFDVAIADSEGRGLLSTDPTNLDHLLPQRQEYEELESGGCCGCWRWSSDRLACTT
jgi:hypothetical protein